MIIKRLVRIYQEILENPTQAGDKKKKRRYSEIQDKDILTLDEAALYLDVDPGTLLEEVGMGRIPGGKLGGQWRFHKWSLLEHFTNYHSIKTNPKPQKQLIPENRGSIYNPTNLIEAYSKGQFNFSGIDLSEAMLQGVALPKINLIEGFLIGTDLSFSNLREAQLQECNLQNARLIKIDLSYADLEGADLSRADLSGAILVKTNLRNAILNDVNLSGAILEETIF